MSEVCWICGVNLKNQHQPWARLVSWPPMLDPGTFSIPGGWSAMPTEDELCERCRGAVSHEQGLIESRVWDEHGIAPKDLPGNRGRG